MVLLRLFLILSLILIILLKRIDVRIKKDDIVTVKISFTIFAIVLTENHPYKRYFFKPFRSAGGLRGIYSSLRFFLKRSTLVFSFGNTAEDSIYQNNSAIDISFHFSLIRLIISALILLYYIVKNKVKRVIRNV